MSTSRSGAAGGRRQSVCLSAHPDPEDPEEEERPGGRLPLVDLSVLRQLEEELGDAEVARSFARDYIGIWDKRIGYLTRSTADEDPDAAMDAVLSLKNSAFMVGAARLASLAVELERIIRNGGLPTAQARVAEINDVGQATIQALRQCYLSQDK